MGRLVTVSTSASTATAGGTIIPLDVHREDFNVHIGVAPVSGTPTINVQFTFQNPLEAGAVPANFTWYPITALTSASATVATALTAPCHAIRIQQPDVGDARIYIIQAGIA